MSAKIIEFGSIVDESFNSIKVEENESIGMIVVSFSVNNKTKDIVCTHSIKGNKLDIVEVLIFLLRNKQELEIQTLFEAVKDHI